MVAQVVHTQSTPIVEHLTTVVAPSRHFRVSEFMYLKPHSLSNRIGDDPHHFFRQVERIFSAMQCTNAERVLFTGFRLEDHEGSSRRSSSGLTRLRGLSLGLS